MYVSGRRTTAMVTFGHRARHLVKCATPRRPQSRNRWARQKMLGARPSDTVVQITSRHNGPDLGETVMRKIAAGLFITLDGIADGEEKWVGPYHSPEFDETIQSLMAAGDTLLLGRVTYEFFAAAFGGQAGPHADYLNSVPKVVVSSTLDRADWQNTTL